MIELLTSSVCAAECDRAPILDLEGMETQPYKFPAKYQASRACPKCSSNDVEAFDPGYEHCWPCGAVWSKSP